MADDLVDDLGRLSFVVQALLARAAAGADVSPVQTRLLGVLRDREPTMQQLAALLELTTSSTTGLVDRAERRGLVVRTLDPDDRRSFRVSLTPPARVLVTEVETAFHAAVEGLLAPLPEEERRRMARSVRAVLKHLDED